VEKMIQNNAQFPVQISYLDQKSSYEYRSR
jgi:hypothetical protein